MRLYVTVILLCWTICLTTACKGPTPQPPSLASGLDSFLKHWVAPDGPGIALLVAKGDDSILFSRGYGLADLKTKASITPQTLFNLGSVTKTMVGFGILQLQEQGKLSIEDSLLHYFPGFRNRELVKNIRIKHLLSHTSGLPDNRPISRDSVFFLTAGDADNFAPILLNDSLLFPPGSHYEYSNPAFNGLALIIEKVSGMKWQDYLKKNLLDKASMPSSVFTDGPYPQRGVAHGYQYANNKWEEYDFGEFPTFCASGNGGAWSSVEELWQYEKAIRRHLFVSASTVALARQVYRPENWADTLPPFTGFDWFVRPLEGWASVGHTGDQGGFRADYVYFPEQGYFIAALSNGSHDLSIVRKEVVRLLKAMENQP